MGVVYDFRNPPESGMRTPDLYAAILEQVTWLDSLGLDLVWFTEHHFVDDGYLPSWIPVAAAMATRTRHVRFSCDVCLLPFNHPIRLAEDLAVLDNLSGGRVDIVLGSGYVEEEFTLYGVDKRERGRRMTETVETLRAAWTGEPFTFRGRTVQVTPTPHQPGGPAIALGGTSEAAARRAARLGCRLMGPSPAAWEIYREEALALGQPDPGPHPGGDTNFFHLATDVEKGWTEVAPYAMHEATSYGRWMDEAGVGRVGGAARRRRRVARHRPVSGPHARRPGRRAAGGRAVRVRSLPPLDGRHPARARLVEPPAVRGGGPAPCAVTPRFHAC